MLPLSGVTVVDLTRLLPGAYCTLALADLGAEVIKIEDPQGGDPVRAMPPFAGGASVYFQALNRNKRSVTLDLRAAAARQVFDALVARADVVVESFRPRTARRLGVSAADLRVSSPRLVHCSITGYGQTGPDAERAGHDINFLALAGLLGVDPPSGNEPPHLPRFFIADIASALHALAGILAALFARERTGEGSAIDVAMYEAALGWLTFPGARALGQGGDLDETRLPLSGRDACYGVYRTADDRYVALGALEPKFWARFCEQIERPEFIPLQYVRSEQPRIRDEVARIVSTRPRDAWIEAFKDVDACLTPVHAVPEALADPQLIARGAFAEHHGSRFVRTPIRLTPASSGPGDAHGHGHGFVPAPAIGADTDAVLNAAGFDEERRRALRAKGVI